MPTQLRLGEKVTWDLYTVTSLGTNDAVTLWQALVHPANKHKK